MPNGNIYIYACVCVSCSSSGVHICFAYTHRAYGQAAERKTDELLASHYMRTHTAFKAQVSSYCPTHMVDTCKHAFYVRGKKRKQASERRAEICFFDLVGFQIKSMRMKGVHSCMSDAMFML